MTPSAWLATGVVVLSFVLLARGRMAPEYALAAGVVVLLTARVLTPDQALAGFANQGLATVALMYVVAAGIRETGGVEFLLRRVLGRPRSTAGAQARLMLPVMAISAFLNNTPVVATFMPVTLRWAKRLNLSPSKLLLPLSYAAILGGTCTLIGTSTNLIVNGLLTTAPDLEGLGLFEIAWVGVPTALIGLGFLLLLGRRLLPDRIPAGAVFDNPREYTLEMVVEEGGPLVGKTVEEAGLRGLAELYLVEIHRDEGLIPAVGPHERLQAGDRLVFAGIIESVVELRRIRGLRAAVDQAFTLEDAHPERCLVEVVVSPRCALLRETLSEGHFRTLYGASVIAVSRRGRRLKGRLGNVRLAASDVLLLETRPSFVQRHRNSRDFLLISSVEDSAPLRHERAWLAWLILAGLVLTTTLGWLSMLEAAMLGAAAMLLGGCCSPAAARQSVDFSVLLAIAAALGLGEALRVTGAAEAMASSLLRLAGANPWLLLVCVYLATSVLTEVVTNNAVAVLMFSIATAAARTAGFEPMPYVIAVMMGASASFATPLGYQTNLMVYGPGGYRFSDYLRIGVPLNIVAGVVTVLVVPLVWPFRL